MWPRWFDTDEVGRLLHHDDKEVRKNAATAFSKMGVAAGYRNELLVYTMWHGFRCLRPWCTQRPEWFDPRALGDMTSLCKVQHLLT